MKHIIFLTCALFAYINTIKAQITISTSDLNGTKWQTARQYDNQSKDYFEYTQRVKIWHGSDGSTFEYPYYLSKSKQTKFDYTKVDVITEGSYIIVLNPKRNIIYCYSIKHFNKTEGTMVLKDMDDERTFTYIFIPSNKPRNQSAKEEIIDNW